MLDTQVVEFAARALLLVFYLSLPPILAAAIVGTLVSLLQALTQIQEQTLSFAIKLFVVIVVIFMTARWLGGELFNYTLTILDSIATLKAH
ncbi:type III secretion system export apparatus subunit SctS [Halochromatium roseum]|jgi:type III secretion protein S|uniref:type III secretion system export apparatus subunit SctS n=1 Tax=Halochromatium roseum TaxID=391920 RepID=UPI0019149D67|nr:type III secretion system export apparatus subunit SctS [Halochromatium roseum]MBK5941091.1 EscS/YscS/HrcS family type III secretion system export apparatus protein [Halochromatium roseum]